MTCIHMFDGTMPYPNASPWEAPQWKIFRPWSKELPHVLESEEHRFQAHTMWVEEWQIQPYGGEEVAKHSFDPLSLTQVADMGIPVCPNCLASTVLLGNRQWCTVQEPRRAYGALHVMRGKRVYPVY